MRRVLIVVEGQTENSFLTRLLAFGLAAKNLAVSAPILGRVGHKGGVVKLDRVITEVSRHLRHDRDCIVTTFFDYYRLNWKSDAASQQMPAATEIGRAHV